MSWLSTFEKEQRKLAKTIARRDRPESVYVIGRVTAVGAGDVTVATPRGEIDEVSVPLWYTPQVDDTVVVHLLDGDPYVASAFRS